MGTGRPGLATTGANGLLPEIGALAVAVGLVLLRSARPVVALGHAVPRPGRVARPVEEI